MAKALRPAPLEDITRAILVLRGQRVLLDAQLAALYGVTTKRLNEQIKRNAGRFPEDFMFQLTAEEATALRSHFATSKTPAGRGGRRYLPYAFTEHGAIQAANVLNSSRAVEMSLYVVRAFVRLNQRGAAAPRRGCRHRPRRRALEHSANYAAASAADTRDAGTAGSAATWPAARVRIISQGVMFG